MVVPKTKYRNEVLRSEKMQYVFWDLLPNWSITNWSINQKRKGNTQFMIKNPTKIDEHS